MRQLALLLATGVLLMGASRCERGHGGGGNGGGNDQDGGSNAGVECGPNTCATGEVCCNESCGICTEPGGACTEQFCGDPDPSGPPRCGGITGDGCPNGGTCVDDPNDDCDPDDGGADCGGTCDCSGVLALCIEGHIWDETACACVPVDDEGGVACGPSTCAEGQVCCNESCGICTEPDGFCTQQFCGDPEPDPTTPPRCGGITGDGCPGAGMCVDDPSDDCDPDNGGADCGGLCECSGAAVLCLVGTIFNDDPSICECEPQDGGGVACGPNTCEKGQVCCNESCGICTEPDGACTEQFCEQEPVPGTLCDMSCEAGFHCELVEVTCIQAPCYPQPECVPSPQCEGFAGFVCPGEGECFDSPNDDCDPDNGGADCGGYCACTVGPLIDCAPDKRFDASPAVCACVDADAGGGAGAGGERCGDNVCPKGETCCNASCGLCAPPDGACIQIACE